MMSEPGPQPAPAPSEPAKKPPPVIPLPTVGEGKDQMDVISKLFKNRILLLGSEVGAVPGVWSCRPRGSGSSSARAAEGRQSELVCVGESRRNACSTPSPSPIISPHSAR